MKDCVKKKTYYINLQESPVPLLMADPHTCSFLGVSVWVSRPPEFFFRKTSGGASRTPPYQFFRKKHSILGCSLGSTLS